MAQYTQETGVCLATSKLETFSFVYCVAGDTV